MNLSHTVLALLTTATLGTQLDAQSYAAFVFDRSGSMTALRSGSGNSRAVDTLLHGNGDINTYFFLQNLFNPPASCLVFEYHGNTVTQLGGVHTTAASAIAAMNSAPAPFGSTPMAAAICSATDALVALDPLAPPLSRQIYVYSDGDENSSPVSSCRAGLPAATSGDHCAQQWPGIVGSFNVGSWQQAVCNIVHGQVTTNFYYFGDFADVVTPEGFFRALADMTGGTFNKVDDSVPVPATTPVVTVGQGCLDFHGTRLTMVSEGLPQVGNTVAVGCRTSNPLPFVLGVGLGMQDFDLGWMGAPGCRLYSSWESMQGFFPWNGRCQFSIPNQPALVGLPLYWQGAQLHGLNNALGLATSNLLRMTIAL